MSNRKRVVTALTSLPVEPPVWKNLPRFNALSTAELLKIRRVVKHLISSAEVKAAAVDFKISTKLFVRTALNFTRTGSVARLPPSLLLKLGKLVDEKPGRFAPEPKRESLTKHRTRQNQIQGLQVYAQNRDFSAKNALIPSQGATDSSGSKLPPPRGVVMESYQEFPNDLEMLCRQEVTQFFLQRAREIKDRRDVIRKAKEEQAKVEAQLKNKKLLKKALKLGNDFEALKLLASGQLPPRINKIEDARTEILIQNTKTREEEEKETEFYEAGFGGGAEASPSESPDVDVEPAAEDRHADTEVKEPVIPAVSARQAPKSITASRGTTAPSKAAVFHEDEYIPVAERGLVGMNDSGKDLAKESDETTELGHLREGEVEVVSMIEPGWEKTKPGKAYEYLQFMDELRVERNKILNPFYYARLRKKEKLNENPLNADELLLSFNEAEQAGLLEGPKNPEEEEHKDSTALAVPGNSSVSVHKKPDSAVQLSKFKLERERKKAEAEEVILDMDSICGMFNRTWSKKIHGRKSSLPRSYLT
jgi:hypothetical protein